MMKIWGSTIFYIILTSTKKNLNLFSHCFQTQVLGYFLWLGVWINLGRVKCRLLQCNYHLFPSYSFVLSSQSPNLITITNLPWIQLNAKSILC